MMQKILGNVLIIYLLEMQNLKHGLKVIVTYSQAYLNNPCYGLIVSLQNLNVVILTPRISEYDCSRR